MWFVVDRFRPDETRWRGRKVVTTPDFLSRFCLESLLSQPLLIDLVFYETTPFRGSGPRDLGTVQRNIQVVVRTGLSDWYFGVEVWRTCCPFTFRLGVEGWGVFLLCVPIDRKTCVFEDRNLSNLDTVHGQTCPNQAPCFTGGNDPPLPLLPWESRLKGHLFFQVKKESGRSSEKFRLEN